MTIRIAIENDLPALVDIYNQSIAAGFETADLTPLKVAERISWFHEHDPGQNPIFVAEQNEKILGWISVSPYRSGRMALRFTREVSYYVDKAHQGKGIGTALMENAISIAKSIHAKTFLAIVLDRNTKSRILLEKNGFTLWGTLPGIADFEGNECGHVYYGLRIY